MNNVSAFRNAILSLHRSKNASYRNAWKKRGEVLSILANIARKVDRIETIADGGTSTPDETVLDTAVDLMVYCLKYQTFLADTDSAIAANLFPASMVGPYSDDPGGFEYLLSRLDLSPLQESAFDYTNWARETVSRFAELEQCFSGLQGKSTAAARLNRVQLLTDAAVKLIARLRSKYASGFSAFIMKETGCAQ